MPSSIYPVPSTAATVIVSLDGTPTGGSGYVTGTATLTGGSSGKTDATVTIDTAPGGVPGTITLVDGGAGYFTGETLFLIQEGADGLSISTATTVTIILVNANILSSPAVITSDMVKPGGGGILRVYFSLAFSNGDEGTIAVYNNNAFKGELNADNDALIEDEGYYRFDLDVEEGDSINLRSIGPTDNLSSLYLVRFHLVQFGAWLIYSHLPQRGGRNIKSNTNFPPQDPPPAPEIKEIPKIVYKEIIVEVPKIVYKERIEEITKIVYKEVIVEVPKIIYKEIIKEIVKEVPKIIYKEVIVEVPKEVPKIIYKEIIKEVVKEVPKIVFKETIENIIKEIPKIVYKEKIETVPKIVYKDVIQEVPKIVFKEVIKEIPKIVYKETIITKPSKTSSNGLLSKIKKLFKR